MPSESKFWTKPAFWVLCLTVSSLAGAFSSTAIMSGITFFSGDLQIFKAVDVGAIVGALPCFWILTKQTPINSLTGLPQNARAFLEECAIFAVVSVVWVYTAATMLDLIYVSL